MLIRWANSDEHARYGCNDSDFGEFDVLAAVDRMSGACLGILAFSRESERITKIDVFDSERSDVISAKLTLCAENQIHPKGGSFHYKYPRYHRESQAEFCPCCNSEPMPDGVEDLAELEHSWVMAERVAQGRLFGKCCVVAKIHSALFYDLAKDDMANFMAEVQAVAAALHSVTGAVKINYEIHGNSGAHLHCHLFPRYLDDDFPSAPIDYRISEPSPYESDEEYSWFLSEMRKKIIP